MEPFIELVACDGETLTDLLDCQAEEEALCQHTEDKEDAVPVIRYDGIRKDRMGVAAAAADDTQDTDIVNRFPAGFEIYDPPAIIRMDAAVAFGSTARAGLCLGLEPVHIGIKEVF
ncbi:MAG: hypothetical protein LUG99_10335 [Lachnospiraceae bacterium]|nr:hypothetical protein [Lachnospiraceae bacterium]